MSANRTPSDVLAVLLWATGKRRFRDDPRLLNGVVLGAAGFDPKPPFDAFLPFAVSEGTYRGSQVLDEAFELLKRLRVLRTETPDTAFVRMDERSREHVLSEILPSFTSDEMHELVRVVRFVRIACCPKEDEP